MGNMASSLQVALALGLFAGQAIGVNNGLARTPQMGWVSWIFNLSHTHL